MERTIATRVVVAATTTAAAARNGLVAQSFASRSNRVGRATTVGISSALCATTITITTVIIETTLAHRHGLGTTVSSRTNGAPLTAVDSHRLGCDEFYRYE